MAKSRQVAAIPVRRGGPSGLKVMLVTSRETQRWVIPKGWPWPKRSDHDAAAGEAWEEAGVRGKILSELLGTFTYDKRDGGDLRRLEVSVFLLEVTEEADKWPEAHERRRQWFTVKEAAELVQEPGLKELLQKIKR